VSTPLSTTAAGTALTLSGRRLSFLDQARVYVCGITPYDVTHLGHAATFVWVDVLGRVLRLLGVRAEVCRNVTDVDDVLDTAARRVNAEYSGFAAIQQFRFERDMDRLGVRPPEHEPRAHRYVEHVMRLAGALLDVGAAYRAGGGVYFRGAGVFERAGLTRDAAVRLAAEYGGRPDDPAKDDPLDVAVWQAGEPGHPAWESPWGPGRPGWHAECAVMAMSVFGPAVDVHAGGADLAFPHHAYHAAMAEAVTGVRPCARAWLHAGTVAVDGVKMAKSAGNLVLLDDLLDRYPAAVLRALIIDRPWSRRWDFTPAAMVAAERRLDELYRAAGRGGASSPAVVAEVTRLLATDLDVPAALDVAIDAGGAPARLLATTLGLS
jgi:cysteinyl-tRNA synthetase